MLAIIQARLSSKRFPLKVLKNLRGKPLIMHVIDRVKLSKQINRIVVATSIEKSDDELTDFLSKNGIFCYRGSLNNVANRMLMCASKYNANEFMRINGDSPLIDPEIIDNAALLNKKGNYDLCTNVLLRSFPKGQSVEIIKTKTLKKYILKFSNSDNEHVTQYFYKNPKKFKIKNFQSKKDFSQIQLSVDTKSDFEIINNIICNSDSILGWEEASTKLINLLNK